MSIKRALGALTFALGMALNPAAFWGCGDGDQPVHNFGEPELLALLDSVHESSGWQLKDAAGAKYLVELEVARTMQATTDRTSALFARRARACGTHTRTLAATAAACSDTYETRLPLVGAVTVSKMDGGALARVGQWPFSGDLVVDGLDLAMAHVYVDARGEGVAFQLGQQSGLFSLEHIDVGGLRLWEGF